MTDFAFAGKTFEVRLDNGVVFHNTYAAEGNKLQYAEIDGATEGASEEVDLYVAEVASRTYLVGWNEVSGTVVTHLMDFKNKRITAFWSFDTGGGRTGEVHSGTFAQVA
ncbi:MoaF-related domain-containing protein [Glycomyces rhizosphaerae]|uniref:MoaF-like domain-containing protein n=1 Tax=Glycomyces rhizosphaerae TaxID=2054422 RepID=A0ABV7Q1B9_9ACTN